MPMDRRTLRNVLAFAKSLQALTPAKKRLSRLSSQDAEEEEGPERDEESNGKSKNRHSKKRDDEDDESKATRHRKSKKDKENEENEEEDPPDRKKKKKRKSKKDKSDDEVDKNYSKSRESNGNEEKPGKRRSKKGSRHSADDSDDGRSSKKQVWKVKEVNGGGAATDEAKAYASSLRPEPRLSDRPAKRVSFSESALRGEESPTDEDARSQRRGRSPQRNSSSSSPRKERKGKDSSKDSDEPVVASRDSVNNGKRSSRRRNSRTNVEPPAIGAPVVVSIDLDRLASGVVRFVGPTQFAQGMWVGVELNQPVGKNDGSVKNVSYFQCTPMHGVFVRPAAAVPPDQEGLLAASLQRAQQRRSNGSIILQEDGSIVMPEVPKVSLAPATETSSAKSAADEQKDDQKVASVADAEPVATIKAAEPAMQMAVVSSSPEEGNVATASTPQSSESTASASSSSRLGARNIELQKAVVFEDDSDNDDVNAPSIALAMLSEDWQPGTPGTPGSRDSFCSHGLSFEEKQVRAEVHLQLATAVEDRDLVQLRKLLPTGLFCGLSLSELDTAHKVLFSEVWWSTMRDVDDVRSSVSRLVDAVATVEELVADCPPQEENPLERQLQQRLWDRMEDRFEAAVQGAVERATRGLESELAAVTRELRGALLEARSDGAEA